MFTKQYYQVLAAQSAYNNFLPTVTRYSTGLTATLTKNYTDYYTRFGDIYNKQTPSIPCLANLMNTTSSYGGVIIGTGTTPPTVDDYCLSGDLITTFAYSSGTTETADDDGITFESLFTITNTGDAAFTIGEVGLICAGAGGTSAETKYKMLLERTVLDSPLTIEAGGVGTLTYTIRLPYPTA